MAFIRENLLENEEFLIFFCLLTYKLLLVNSALSSRVAVVLVIIRINVKPSHFSILLKDFRRYFKN